MIEKILELGSEIEPLPAPFLKPSCGEGFMFIMSYNQPIKGKQNLKNF